MRVSLCLLCDLPLALHEVNSTSMRFEQTRSKLLDHNSALQQGKRRDKGAALEPCDVAVTLNPSLIVAFLSNSEHLEPNRID